ncbi:MAG: RNA polymerase sigma factor [Verrucomicrobiae bacterium]|nr:RNA polymerase sigma factor [Verrucomicrobiae bacterium]
MRESEPDARIWVAACLAGDDGAARRLVECLHPTVIRIVRAHLPRRDTEEDLAQEVFMKIFSRLDRYEGKVPLEHWVSRIAVTTCIDRLRAQRRRPELRWADLSAREAEVLERGLERSGDPSPDEAVAARDLVRHLLETLKPQDRLLLQWMDMEGRSIEEVRARTGWSASAVKVRAFRARRKMRHLLEAMEARGDERPTD